MRNFLFFTIILFIFGSCKRGELYPSIKEKIVTEPPTVTSVRVELDKIIVEGENLENTTALKIKDSNFSKTFTITLKESKKLVAKNNEASSIPSNSLLELIISTAGAQTPSIIPITFIPAKDSIDSRSLEDESVTEDDLDNDAVATEKVQDGAITRLKLGPAPGDNPMNGDVFMWQNGEFELVSSGTLIGGSSRAASLTEIFLGEGIVGDGTSITSTGIVAVDVGETGDSSYTKIPFFSSTNELAIDSSAKILFKDTNNFSLSNDSSLKIKLEPAGTDLVIVEGSGNTTITGDLVVSGSNFTVGGKTACLSDGTNCPSSSGVNSISSADSTIIQGGTAQDVTLAVDVGVNPNQIVQLDSSGKLPPVDGSQLTNIPGAITAVIAGDGLTGGGTSGDVRLDVITGGEGGYQLWRPRLDNLGTLNILANGVIIGRPDLSEFEVQAGITFQDSVRLLPDRDIMAYDQSLDDLGNLAPTTNGDYIRYNGSNWSLANIPVCGMGEVITSDASNFSCTPGGVLGPGVSTQFSAALFSDNTGRTIQASLYQFPNVAGSNLQVLRKGSGTALEFAWNSILSASDGNPSNALIVDATGNVGINQTIPTHKLQVVVTSNGDGIRSSNMAFGQSAHGSGWPGLWHTSQNNTGGYALIQSSAGGTLLNAASGQNLDLRNNNASRFRVNNTQAYALWNARLLENGATAGNAAQYVSGWQSRNYNTGQDQQYLRCRGVNIYSYNGQIRSNGSGGYVFVNEVRFSDGGIAYCKAGRNYSGWGWLGCMTINTGELRFTHIMPRGVTTTSPSNRSCFIISHRDDANRIVMEVTEISHAN